jgi:hypothetical protein
MKETKNNIGIKDADVILKRKELIEIKDGLHKGRICKVELFKGEYEYIHIGVLPTDLIVPKNMETPVLKIGYPLALSVKSGLGKLLMASGFDIMTKENYTLKDLETQLLGKLIQFQTLTQKTDKGEFSNILQETIKFIN